MKNPPQHKAPPALLIRNTPVTKQSEAMIEATRLGCFLIQFIGR
jgi:hypothetical protein